MSRFSYASRDKVDLAKNHVLGIVGAVRKWVKDVFNIQSRFVSSTSRNMATVDLAAGAGCDLSLDIKVVDKGNTVTSRDIREGIIKALEVNKSRLGILSIEEQTQVILIKFKDGKTKLIHSCAIMLVHNSYAGQQYIRVSAGASRKYSWEYQSRGYVTIPDKIEWLKNNDYWDDFRTYYLDKKNADPEKLSRILFAEVVQEMCQKFGYYD